MGAETAKAALLAGNNVVATSRDPRKIKQALDTDSDRLLVVALDSTKEAQVHAAVEAAIHTFGRIDADIEARYQTVMLQNVQTILESKDPRDTQRDESKQTIRGTTTFS